MTDRFAVRGKSLHPPAPGSERPRGLLTRARAMAQFVGAISQLIGNVLLWVGAIVVPFGIALAVMLLINSVVAPPKWYFSVNARTEVAALELPGALETGWRIEGAILCSTARNLDPLQPRGAAASPCGGPRWAAYTFPRATDSTIMDEQVLILGGTAPGGQEQLIKVTMEVREDGGLQLAIRSKDAAPLGVLRLASNDVVLPLSSPINLVWPGTGRPRDLVFPFYGEKITIGRDVSASHAGMLREGVLTVQTGSDETLGKRAQVEQMTLMPGDQVRLQKWAPDEVPKGFLRFDRVQSGKGEPPTLTAVAYGRAESLKIERFGESGYEFSPGWWVGIVHHRALAIVSLALAGLLAVLGGYASIRQVPIRLHESWSASRGHLRRTAGAAKGGKGDERT